MKLSPVAERFVLHWGEMGSCWGVNRSVAQIHALLYISPRPLNAEEIAETLALARSTVSSSLRELQGWRLVTVSHVMGDRRDHFSTLTDVWKMASIVGAERKRREIDPTVEVLRACVEELKAADDGESAYLLERLEAMNEFVTAGVAVYDQAIRLPLGALRRLIQNGAGIIRRFGGNGGESGSAT